MGIRQIVVLISLVILAIVLFQSVFIVDQTRQAIVLKLGRPQKTIQDPGLSFKKPFIEDVTYFDKRILDLDVPEQEVLSTDQLRLIVDAFARFRITDPLLLYQSVRTGAEARSRLEGILSSALRDELGKQPFAALLSPERGQMMEDIKRLVNIQAETLGAKVVDVRIKRADLPKGHTLNATYERMRSAREQQARTIRAQGRKKAEQIKAQADAEAARIYAESFGQDAKFFAFYRSMRAYKKSLQASNTTIVLSPDNEFLSEFYKKPN